MSEETKRSKDAERKALSRKKGMLRDAYRIQCDDNNICQNLSSATYFRSDASRHAALIQKMGVRPSLCVASRILIGIPADFDPLFCSPRLCTTSNTSPFLAPIDLRLALALALALALPLTSSPLLSPIPISLHVAVPRDHQYNSSHGAHVSSIHISLPLPQHHNCRLP